MFIRKILPAFAVAALGVVAATAFGHGSRDVKCPPGNTNPAYCTTTPDTTPTQTTPTDTTPTQTVTEPSQSPPPAPTNGTAGNDTLNITKKPKGILTLLGGTDSLTVTGKFPVKVTGTGGKKTIKTGNGSDNIKLTNSWGSITTGNGNDVVNVTGPKPKKGQKKVSYAIDTGAGNDRITMGAHALGSVVAGAGNDVINVKNGVKNSVDCGPGKDVVTADKKLDVINKNCEKVHF